MSTDAETVASDDVAQRALEELVVELDRCLADLTAARARAEKLLVERRAGRSWLDVVTGEARPLVVERISALLREDAPEAGRA